MKKYLEGKKMSPSDIALTLELQKQFDEQLLYCSHFQKQLWFQKVEESVTTDDFAKTLITIHNRARKHTVPLAAAIYAYGRRLYAR